MSRRAADERGWRVVGYYLRLTAKMSLISSLIGHVKGLRRSQHTLGHFDSYLASILRWRALAVGLLCSSLQKMSKIYNGGGGTHHTWQ
jgi:hypothetical protein